MKGQYLTIEYVLFFAIGIALVVGIYTTFNSINAGIREDSGIVQFEKLGESIRGSIVKIYEYGIITDSTIEYKLKIPTKISGGMYLIKYDNLLNVNSTENYKIGTTLDVYNINIRPSNIIYSTKGEINIKYNEGWVELS
ncbi:MAG: hypothetical protein KJ697_00430 [Nanoarchaeota archaeon]|nr:hypothetical protein [Nanoarchaeota archaeon]MBU4124186.1 hypothetical protein [Nanoarchaeota archaeon]